MLKARCSQAIDEPAGVFLVDVKRHGKSFCQGVEIYIARIATSLSYFLS